MSFSCSSQMAFNYTKYINFYIYMSPKHFNKYSINYSPIVQDQVSHKALACAHHLVVGNWSRWSSLFREATSSSITNSTAVKPWSRTHS